MQKSSWYLVWLLEKQFNEYAKNIKQQYKYLLLLNVD
jgi:hypothetical protein